MAGGSLGALEQETFRLLKEITGDLLDSIGKYEVGKENTTTTGNEEIDTLKIAEPPVPQSDILVLLVYKKGDAPESPLKTVIAYKSGELVEKGILRQETVKNGLIDSVVKSAKKYVGLLMDSALESIHDSKGAAVSEDETGYVVRLPHLSPGLFVGRALRSLVPQKGEKGNLLQPLPSVMPDTVDATGAKGFGPFDIPPQHDDVAKIQNDAEQQDQET